LATESLATVDLGGDSTSAPFDCSPFTQVYVQVTWTGADATDGEFKCQLSVEGTSWADAGGERTRMPIDEPANTRSFFLKQVATRFLRVKYSANTNTTGTAEVKFYGERK